MGSPTRYKVGDIVRITEEQIVIMRNSNMSCVTTNYPSDNFIEKVSAFSGVDGEVTHIHLPGYEVTVKFGEQSFHMEDNWIVKYGAEHMRGDIKGKLL
jgi:glycosylphosphatidylinositol transamidase (GPIT) subunit GPI8